MNGGYLNGYKTYWWNHTGYCAGTRGFNADETYLKVGYAYGWKTLNSAVNYAQSKLGPYRYNMSTAWANNRSR